MLQPRKKAPPLLRRWYASRLALVLESVLIGAAVGFVVVAFRLLLSSGDAARRALYNALAVLPWQWTALWCLALIPAGLLLGFLSRRFPMIRGSGIPQIKGELRRLCTSNWLGTVSKERF